MNHNEAYTRIGEYIESHHNDSYSDIGSKLGLSRHQVSRIARLRGIKRSPGKRSAALQAAVAIIEATMAQPDSVSADAPANPPMEVCISTAPDAPSTEQTLAPTPETAPAELPVA